MYKTSFIDKADKINTRSEFNHLMSSPVCSRYRNILLLTGQEIHLEHPTCDIGYLGKEHNWVPNRRGANIIP